MPTHLISIYHSSLKVIGHASLSPSNAQASTGLLIMQHYAYREAGLFLVTLTGTVNWPPNATAASSSSSSEWVSLRQQKAQHGFHPWEQLTNSSASDITMWIFYVLLSVILTNSICRSVSAQHRVNIVDVNGETQSRTIHSMLKTHLTTASFGIRCHNQDAHSIEKRANSVTPSGRRSPLLEVMLRILDTIQLVPKKRSRRSVVAELPKWRKSLSPERQTLLNSLDPSKVKQQSHSHFLRVSFLCADNMWCGLSNVRLPVQFWWFWCHVVHLCQNTVENTLLY